MKKNQSKLPSTLWYVESKEYLKTIQSKGIYNFNKKQKFIHNLSCTIDYVKLSVSDFLAVNNLVTDNPEYVLFEIDTSKLDFKIRKCHTEGMVISEAVYHIDLIHIQSSSIIGYEIKNINFEELQNANFHILWKAMNLKQISQHNSSIEPKYHSLNNRLLSFRKHACRFNSKLCSFPYGEKMQGVFVGRLK
jgi:hypothetical protein